MAVYKNVASQKLAVFAVDSTGAAKTGDAANITAYISKDGGAASASNDTNPTELDATNAKGIYIFDMTQTETNADLLVLVPKSATSGVTLRPVIVYTEPQVRDVNVTKVGSTSQTAGDLAALLATIAGYIDTEVSAIKAKTDNLPSDPADASDIAASFSTVNSTLSTIAAYIDTEVAAIKAKTDNLPSDPADASDISSAFGTVNSTLSTIAAYIDTEVAAIKAKTDNLPTDPADASDIAASFSSIASTLSTIAGYIDTEVAAIKAKTDLIPASPAAVGSAMTLADASVDSGTITAAAANKIADHVRRRTNANVEASTDGDTLSFRSEYGAIAKLTNKVAADDTTLTVYKADDTTALGTQTITSDAEAEPITGVDTV